EPTAVLTPQEADELFDVIRSLTQQGTSIIFITHKLREVLAVADRIVVLRRGEVVGETSAVTATERSLAEMMVGRSVVLEVEKTEAHPAETVLNVHGLSTNDDRGQKAVDGVSFEVRAGEILGIAGVQGNGQTELIEAITGMRPVLAGDVRIGGNDYTNASPRKICEAGCAHIPEDRQKDGLVLSYSISDNLVLNSYYVSPFAQGGVMREQAIRDNAIKLVDDFDIRTPSPFVPVSTLSGGNKQKVIIAREISRGVNLIIAAQPTRGVDVGSIEFIHKAMVMERDRGAAVLLISAELDEILSLSDRIAVMYHGQIVATLPTSEATREQLGLLMAGAEDDQPVEEGQLQQRVASSTT
ncbi:MAG: ATP-binding cassette domain-containing protein, partial [Chloroflexota bacterium]